MKYVCMHASPAPLLLLSWFTQPRAHARQVYLALGDVEKYKHALEKYSRGTPGSLCIIEPVVSWGRWSSSLDR